MKPTYSQRNALLPQLGFSTYVEYLASALWAEIRDAVLDRDNSACRLCHRKTTVVHHIDYNETTLLGDTLDGLVSVCHGCHKKIEFTEDGKKRTLFQAIRAYNSLCSKPPKKRKGGKDWKQKIRSIISKKRKLSRKNHAYCKCGNFRRQNRLMCRICEPNGKIVRGLPKILPVTVILEKEKI